MGVDGGVTGGTSQVLVLSVRNVEVSLRIAVLLGQTEIDHVDLVATLANAHEKVVGLDIAVDEGLGVDVLDAGNELIGEQENGLERELAVAEVEKIFERRAEQIKDHGVVVALGAEPAHEGNTDTASERLVDAGFILKLRVLSLDTLELDSNLLARDDVSACGGLAQVKVQIELCTHPGRCHRRNRYRSCGQFCTYYRRGDPVTVSCWSGGADYADSARRCRLRGVPYHCRHGCCRVNLRRLACR